MLVWSTLPQWKFGQDLAFGIWVILESPENENLATLRDFGFELVLSTLRCIPPRIPYRFQNFQKKKQQDILIILTKTWTTDGNFKSVFLYYYHCWHTKYTKLLSKKKVHGF